MKKIIFTLISLGVVSCAFADDAGSFSGGGDSFSSGSSSGSAGSATNTGGDPFSLGSGTGGNNAQAGVIVPPIVGVGSSTANSSGGNNSQSADGLMNSDSNATDDKSISDDNKDSDSNDDNDSTKSKGRNSAISRNNSNYGRDPFVDNVYIRSGMRLKKYGVDMFRTPRSFSPAQNIPVPSNYVIGPGDELRVQSWGAVNALMNAKVKPDGSIFVPKLGVVPVTGVRAGELDGYMKKRLGKIYRNFDLTSNVSKIRGIRVSVAGMARSPGTYSLSSLSTLSNAVAAVGGPSALGSLRDIELVRNGHVVGHFDAYALLLNGDNSRDIPLVSGDVIRFKPIGAEVAIYDGVKRPAIYEIKPGEDLQDLINYAGGYTSDAKSDDVVIETVAENKAINVNTYKTANARNMQLSDGEIIHFFRTTNKYENTVAVVGNVVDPTRTGYRSGMTVRDLIPNKEALLTRSYYNSYAYNTYGRDNTLTQMDIEKTTGQSAAGGLNLTTGLQSTQNLSNAKSVFGGGQNLFIAGPAAIPEADINWNYALIVRVDPTNYSTHIIPFNLRKAIAGDPANNISLKPGDVVNVLSAKDVRTSIASGPIYIFVDGEVNSPGVYELKAGNTLKDAIESAGGITNKAYVFGMELDRDSVKKQQSAALNQMLDQAQQTILAQSTSSYGNVASKDQGMIQRMAMQQQLSFIAKMRQIRPSGRVVLNLQSANSQLKDLPEFRLENGDTIYIPPIPDVVNVVGQVYNPATFIYNRDYSVGKYIEMAGTENQYADKSVEYVLRADGTLYSKQQAGWFGSFASRSLNPGDVIIVPQEIQFGGTVQNLINWTQVLANFGTAAAAITVFK